MCEIGEGRYCGKYWYVFVVDGMPSPVGTFEADEEILAGDNGGLMVELREVEVETAAVETA